MWHCVLWDNLPFLNLLFILPAYRGKGYGAGAMAQWEQAMKKRGFKTLLISTQVDEKKREAALLRSLPKVFIAGCFGSPMFLTRDGVARADRNPSP